MHGLSQEITLTSEAFHTSSCWVRAQEVTEDYHFFPTMLSFKKAWELLLQFKIAWKKGNMMTAAVLVGLQQSEAQTKAESLIFKRRS